MVLDGIEGYPPTQNQNKNAGNSNQRVVKEKLAKDIMKCDLITIARNSVAQAAQITTRNRISGLPVIGENSNDAGNLVGIITKTDIIKVLASTVN